MSLNAIYRKSLEGKPLADHDISTLINLEPERLPEFLALAHKLRLAHFGDTLGLCAIINAKSGTCSEDCAFCAQSGHHATRSPEFPLLPTEEIADAGSRAKEHGVTRFGVVASGKLVGHSDYDGYMQAVKALAKLGLKADLSPGILDLEQLKALKAAGLWGYHHNLETSRSYFPKICTTHDYEEDVQAVRNAKDAGLYVCCGGIFGIGESWDDRVELALLLGELGVDSVPINFLQPIPGTPLEGRELLSAEEALRITALYRFLLPDRAIRICGGRLAVFDAARKKELLTAGASGIMVGDYLTTKGGSVHSDLQEIKDAGLVLETL